MAAQTFLKLLTRLGLAADEEDPLGEDADRTGEAEDAEGSARCRSPIWAAQSSSVGSVTSGMSGTRTKTVPGGARRSTASTTMSPP